MIKLKQGDRVKVTGRAKFEPDFRGMAGMVAGFPVEGWVHVDTAEGAINVPIYILDPI